MPRRLHQPEPRRLPFLDGRFDLVTAFEMIEHVDDDLAMMREIARVLKPGGAVLLTAPAFPMLWTIHDDAAHHKRRYRKAEFLSKLGESGFAPERMTCLDCFLLPLILSVRWLRDRMIRGKEVTSDFNFKIPRPLNAVFRAVFMSE